MSKVDFKALAAEFDQSEIDFRPARSGKDAHGRPWVMLYAHIDARTVQNRLDKVVGPERWSNRNIASPNGVVCELSIEITPGQWVTKSDGASETDIESFKGANSRALCRAASAWGIGRYLYDMPTIFAEFVTQGTEGSFSVKVDNQTFYIRAPQMNQPVEVSRPIPQSHVPSVSRSISRPVENRPIESRPQVVSRPVRVQVDAGDEKVPFGQTKGKRLRELTDAEIRGLHEFYRRVTNPQGRALSFKTAFDKFMGEAA